MAAGTLLYHVEEMAWCELATELKSVNTGLSQVERPNIGLCGKLTWGVKDIDKARANLEAKKVRFDGPTQEIPGMVKLVLQKRKERVGRNPATGAEIQIPAKTVVKARIVKQLKGAVLPKQ